MNTITIEEVNTDGVTHHVQYTEQEFKNYKKRAEHTDALNKELNSLRTKVRDYFAELEWSNHEATVSRNDVNDLLTTIGADVLQTMFSATVTITATVNRYVADDEQSVRDWIGDEITVDISYPSEISVDEIHVDYIEEEE